jgi:signal transduction histidine kinase
LGLALVRRIVALAGGRAEARNSGSGLEVRLVFPAAS